MSLNNNKKFIKIADDDYILTKAVDRLSKSSTTGGGMFAKPSFSVDITLRGGSDLAILCDTPAEMEELYGEINEKWKSIN